MYYILGERRMSFVYAEKIKYTLEDKQIQGIKIYSDTKVSIEGAVKTNWSEQQRKAIEKYGMCKSMQIASLNGHLCHIWRPACDLNGGQPRTH